MHPYIAVPATLLLVLRAWSNNSLTPLGIIVAALTATAHAVHPWSVFFALLVVFFLGGTATTKVKHHEKAKLTHSSTGDAGGEGPRTHVQVLANSAVASVLILLHAFQLHKRREALGHMGANVAGLMDEKDGFCFAYGHRTDLLVVGIVAQYAAAAADTFASELGILSKTPPRLITSWNLRPVPPGTNGGVTLAGTLAGIGGALTIALTAVILTPFCSSDAKTWTDTVRKFTFSSGGTGLQGGVGWGTTELLVFVVSVAAWGALGSLLDSIFGATLQYTVVDAKSGRVVEGKGGARVLVEAPAEKSGANEDSGPSRKVVSGLGWLDNNGVNFVMLATMAMSAMGVVGWAWNVPMSNIFQGNVLPY